MDTNRLGLPATFRVTGSRGQARALVHMIQKKFVQEILKGVISEENGTDKVQIFPLPWLV